MIPIILNAKQQILYSLIKEYNLLNPFNSQQQDFTILFLFVYKDGQLNLPVE